jgi:hypothetical protein
MKYPKMLNLYKFDEKTKGRKGEMSCPEFEYLKDCTWQFTEKLDGMNMRVIFDEDNKISIRGRTDKAQLKEDLVDTIKEMFKDVVSPGTTFFGEGIGPKIQKNIYKKEKRTFVLFDIHDDTNDYWLDTKSVKEVAQVFGIPRVPVLFAGTLRQGYLAVKHGLFSVLNPGKFAEGLVGKPLVSVRNRSGGRIIVKIKGRDYFGKDCIKIT